GTFCIPFLSVGSGQTQTIRMVLTNVSAAASVQITDGKRSFLDTVMVPTGCSYLWDSAALGRDATTDGQIVVACTNNFTCAATVTRNKLFFLRPLPSVRSEE